jgi:alpha-beta hydrolase superfamily lysophospholipase
VNDIISGAEELCTLVCETFSEPVLILHGSEDVLTCPEASEDFIKRCCSKDKTFKRLLGFYHDLHIEPVVERQIVIDECLRWVKKRSFVHLPELPN